MSMGHPNWSWDEMRFFLNDVFEEAERARKKFPENEANMCALTEEVGELAEALMDKPWREVYKEAVQVAAMALRCATEGDPTIDGVRVKRGQLPCHQSIGLFKQDREEIGHEMANYHHGVGCPARDGSGACSMEHPICKLNSPDWNSREDY